MNTFTIIPDRITPKIARDLGLEIHSEFHAFTSTTLWHVTRKGEPLSEAISCSTRSRKKALETLRSKILLGFVKI